MSAEIEKEISGDSQGLNGTPFLCSFFTEVIFHCALSILWQCISKIPLRPLFPSSGKEANLISWPPWLVK
jgi:hypothetical protein